MEYVWSKMHENPDVVPSLISVIDGMATMKARDLLSECVRRFSKVSRDKCIVIMSELCEGIKSQSFEKVPVDHLRSLLCFDLA